MRVKIESDEFIIDFTDRKESKSTPLYSVKIIKKNFIINDYKTFPRNKINIYGNKVTLRYLTCTCKEYTSNELLYPPRDIRRICNHIYIALSKTCMEKMGSLESNILNHKFWYKLSNVFQIEIEKQRLFIGYGYDYEIFYVYPFNKPDTYFTYNCNLSIWKENVGPFENEFLNISINTFLRRVSFFLKKYSSTK
jgi:hypothetical protein